MLFVTHSIPEAIRVGNRIALFSPHPGQIKAEVNSSTDETRLRSLLFDKDSDRA
jgi:NitT/TauT family transport system ATP-binding protein